MKEYPLRPRLVLDGEHLFSFDPENRGVRDEWFARTDLSAVRMPVPGVWQANLRMSANVGWYWIPFEPDESFKDTRPCLPF